MFTYLSVCRINGLFNNNKVIIKLSFPAIFSANVPLINNALTPVILRCCRPYLNNSRAFGRPVVVVCPSVTDVLWLNDAR